MSVKFVRRLSESDFLGVWCIEETEENDFPFVLSERLRSIVAQYKNQRRKIEVLCTYALLFSMTGRQDLVINHLPSGKPFLEDWYLSITHTLGYVSVLLSRKHEVALDMEYRSSRVQRVAKRFLRPDEHPENLDELLLHWCAKESAYKYWSSSNLEFEEIKVYPIVGDVLKKGNLCVENMREGTCLSLVFEFFPDAVLVYSEVDKESENKV